MTDEQWVPPPPKHWPTHEEVRQIIGAIIKHIEETPDPPRIRTQKIAEALEAQLPHLPGLTEEQVALAHQQAMELRAAETTAQPEHDETWKGLADDR